MLEVGFSDNAATALMVAQSKSNIIGESDIIAMISNKKFSWFTRRKLMKEYSKYQKEYAERDRELNEQMIPLGGTKDDLARIFSRLSMGDISSENGQKALIFKIISNDKQAAEDYFQTFLDGLKKLKDRASKGEAVRIWADNTPDGACGFLYVCDLLKDSECPVTVVKLPVEVKRADKVTVRYRGWGEVEPQLFGKFAEEYSVSLNKETILKYAEEWRKLREENSLLRAVENGKVISAGEDYYDGIIRGCFPKGSCSIAEIIGNVLAKELAVSDFLIAQRIKAFIDSGELKIIKESPDRFYSTTVEKA